jgi:hypothetical protein
MVLSPTRMERIYKMRKRQVVGKCQVCGRPIPEYYGLKKNVNDFRLSTLNQFQVCFLMDQVHIDFYNRTNNPGVFNDVHKGFDTLQTTIKKEKKAGNIIEGVFSVAGFILLGLAISMIAGFILLGLALYFLIAMPLAIKSTYKGQFGPLFKSGGSLVSTPMPGSYTPQQMGSAPNYGQQQPNYSQQQSNYSQQQSNYSQQQPNYSQQQPMASVPTSTTTQNKQCQYCSADLPAGATVCPICGMQ